MASTKKKSAKSPAKCSTNRAITPTVKSLRKKSKKVKALKQDIEAIKAIDPELYNFLKDNDQKLLEFNVFDSDDESENDSEEEAANETTSDADENEEKTTEEKFHKPSKELEVASDESDFEDGTTGASHGPQKVTLNLLRQWQLELEKPNVSVNVIRDVIKAFNSALASISVGNDEVNVRSGFIVIGTAAFNGVVQLCLLHLQSAIYRFLGVNVHSTAPLHKMKKWLKVRSCLRHYLMDVICLIDKVCSPNVMCALLKHLHQMAIVAASFSTQAKTILKRLITIWSTGEEAVRVLAFLCILKIIRNMQGSVLNHVLKAMYLAYVRNSKFVSPNTLPFINFMRRSLLEVYALDVNVSYKHVFLYIRQLAIHLRNALILKKKGSLQAIYNWQYINSLRLWSELLGAAAYKGQLEPLVYPLVNIICSVIGLIPTAQYFPLRFHCVQMLISLAKSVQVYIPVLPYIIEVLRSNTFNRKHTAVSMRPQQFTCILRLNKTQLAENGFRDEVIEQVFNLALEFLEHNSTSIAFCELVVPTVISLKDYLKTCRNPNYSRKIKQLVDKIMENSKFIEQERLTFNKKLNDLAQVAAWVQTVRNKGTPLSIYYHSWVKTQETKKRRQAAQSDNINTDYGIPSVKKTKIQKSTNAKGEVELFPSDSEDEPISGLKNVSMDREEEAPKPKKKNKKKVSKEIPIQIEKPEEEDLEKADAIDIVKDLDIEDW